MPLFFNQLEGNSEKMQARCAERTLYCLERYEKLVWPDTTTD